MKDRAGDFGGIDAPSLGRIRNIWIDMEPLVTATRYDDDTNPSELRVDLSDGIGEATRARIDIQWSALGYYSFHYTDDNEVNWRFDHHPNPHSSEKHFHPPPMASTADAKPSCIEVETRNSSPVPFTNSGGSPTKTTLTCSIARPIRPE